MTNLNFNAFVYRFLSRAFAYPNDAFLPALRENLAQTGEMASDLSPIVDLLSEESPVNLQAEYTRLFISGYPKTPCPPYESAYREGRLMGQANVSVRALYSQWGMVVDPPLGDHIATELEFLAFLTALAMTAPEIAEQALTTRAAFLSEHPGQWIPQFAANLQTHAQIEGYRLLANLLLTNTWK